MKKLISVILLGLSVSPVFGYAGDIDDRVNFDVVVNVADHKGVMLVAGNLGKSAKVCSHIKIKGKVSFPNAYENYGEVAQNQDDIFVYGRHHNRPFSKVYLRDKVNEIQELNGEELIVTSASIDKERIRCRLASFYDYCKFAQKDDFEKLSLAYLGFEFGTMNCKSLSFRLTRQRSISLDTEYLFDYRFIEYLRGLRMLRVNRAYEDQSGYFQSQNRVRVIGKENVMSLDENFNLEEAKNIIDPVILDTMETFDFSK